MFKKQLLVFSILFNVFTITAQNKLPSIHEVAKKFYNTYDINELSYPEVGFEKRKNGWTVTTKKIANNELVNEQSYLYYNGIKSVYAKLPLKNKLNKEKVDYKSYLTDYQIRNYQFHQFYGYEGWYKDVIAHLSKTKKLSDTSLYSLARAYSTYASALLSLQTGEALKSDLFKLPLQPNCINNAQLKLYDSLAYLAEATFKKLVIQNPKFETIVGPIAMKYANEVMVHFHAYLVYANKLASKFQLPENLYSDSVIVLTKRLLEKCPTNSILLSLGDNDFYPVLYLQHKLGIRKDVYLINQSLLGLDRFIYRATFSQFDANPIHLSIDTNFYIGNRNDYMLIEKKDSTVHFKEVIQFIKSSTSNSQPYMTISANNFLIDRLDKNNQQSIIELKLKTRYLFKSDWVLLDILQNLKGRNFCYQTPLDKPFDELNKYFKMLDEHLYVY